MEMQLLLPNSLQMIRLPDDRTNPKDKETRMISIKEFMHLECSWKIDKFIIIVILYYVVIQNVFFCLA